MTDTLVEQLDCLHVWPQSVASHHVDVLTPRQIEELYAIGGVATDAVTRIRSDADRIIALGAELKTVLDREADTHRRHDAMQRRCEAQAAEIEKLREALAAAPDLLEACEAFLIYDDAADYDRSLHRNVQTLTRAAITKARGEASNIARAALAGKAEQ